MRQTFLSIFVWRSLILQWKTLHALFIVFSVLFVELGNGDHWKRNKSQNLVDPRRKFCLMFHLMLPFLFPISTFPLFSFVPFINQLLILYMSFTLSSLELSKLAKTYVRYIITSDTSLSNLI